MCKWVCRGIAFDAKLAFSDLGSDGISTPEDLATQYYNYAYTVGARVHSDSWGTTSTSYDYMATQVDLFSWQNQVNFRLPELADNRQTCTQDFKVKSGKKAGVLDLFVQCKTVSVAAHLLTC